MDIEYIEPLKRAWERMVSALFRPFDMGKWVVIGFAAWIAWLGQRSGGFGGSGNWGSGGRNAEDMRQGAGQALDKVREVLANPVWLGVIVAAAALLVALGFLITWVSSRGKFVFLDNVATSGCAIVEPWERTRALGNSLFLWRVVFGLAVCAAALVMFAGLWSTLAAPFLEGNAIRVGASIAIGAAWALLMVPVLLTVFFLENFVVPVMYRHGLSASEAWSRFLRLLTSRPWPFIGYALLVFVLSIAVAIGTVIISCATCCIGAIVLMLPYIGTVVLLPVLYTYRAWSLEFLAQFGPEWDAWAHEAPGTLPPSSGEGA